MEGLLQASKQLWIIKSHAFGKSTLRRIRNKKFRWAANIRYAYCWWIDALKIHKVQWGSITARRMSMDCVSTDHRVWRVHLLFVNRAKEWVRYAFFGPERKFPAINKGMNESWNWINKVMPLHHGMIIPWCPIIYVGMGPVPVIPFLKCTRLYKEAFRWV